MAGAGMVLGGKIARSAPDPIRAAGTPPLRGAAGTGVDWLDSAALGVARSPADTVWGWLPAPVNPPGSLLVVDTTAVTNDTRVALAILQGLANRRMPSGGQAAYLQVPPMANCFPEEVFNLWPEVYSRQLAMGSESGTAEDLVNLALQRGVEQYVIWDPTVPATINVATTLAWLYGTAAFGPDDAVGPLADGLGLFLDLRSLDLKTAANAYRWALGEMSPRLRPPWPWCRWAILRVIRRRAW